jgi:phage head maturation protease
MTTDFPTAEVDDAVELLEAADGGDRRTLRVRLLRYGEVGNLETGPEVLEAGAFEGTDPSRVTVEALRHGGSLVGVGTSLEDLDGEPYLDATIARTPAGDELLELARARVLRAASIVYRPVPGASRSRADRVNVRSRVELVRVAVLERGAFASAEVVAASHPTEVPSVTDQPVPTLEEIGSLVRGIVADAVAAPAVVPVPTGNPAPRIVIPGRFSDLLEASLAGTDADVIRAVAREVTLAAAAPTEVADGVTGDVPSIVRPAWLNRIIGILPTVRNVVGAFGTEALPDTGMEVDWPTWAADYSARVGVQAAEKDLLLSKKVVLGSDKATVATYGGCLDQSWQVLRRSSPSYRDAVLRILSIAWAMETEKAFAAAVVAKGTGTGTLDATDDKTLHASFLDASAKVDDATGSPATFVLAAPDKWLEIGTAAGLVPPAYGTQNVGGVAQASTLRIEVSGLPVIRAKGLAAGSVIVSNGEAASWLEDGMYTATQDVVTKLGTDVAVWSLGAPAIYIPTGIVKMAASGA